jgi:hypothetical protein
MYKPPKPAGKDRLFFVVQMALFPRPNAAATCWWQDTVA